MVPGKIVPLSHCPQVAAEYGVGLFESAYAIKGGSVTKVKIVEMANARSFSTHYEILSCYFFLSWRLSLSYVQKKMPIGVSLSFCVIYKCMTNSRKYHLFCFSVFRKKTQSFLICHRFRNLAPEVGTTTVALISFSASAAKTLPAQPHTKRIHKQTEMKILRIRFIILIIVFFPCFDILLVIL